MREKILILIAAVITAVAGLGVFLAEHTVYAAPEEISIDSNHFENATFRSYVKNNFDKDKNGKLSQKEIDNVKYIKCEFKYIDSFKGVEYFTKLKGLNICWNSMTELDISKNKELEILDCSSNALTQLNVSNNTALQTLNCSGNKLIQLDVSKNKELEMLDCTSNALTQLNVSNNTALKTLACGENQLTQLNVANNTALEELLCYDNQLKELNVSRNTKLRRFVCARNQLTQLNVDKNTALEWFECNGNQLKELNVSRNSALFWFNCQKNQLTQLKVDNNKLLLELYCDNNLLKELDVSNNTKMDRLICANNQLTQLNVGNNTELENFECNNNRLSTLDISKNTKLQNFNCSHNLLKELNAINNKNLKSIECSYNQLTVLKIPDTESLNKLKCYSNQLSSLDVSKNTALIVCECGDNKLNTLDVRKNIALQKLNCNNNKLEKLDIRYNEALYYLDCNGNRLTMLDVSRVPKLKEVVDVITPSIDGTVAYYKYVTIELYVDKNVKCVTVSYDVTFNANGGSGTMEGLYVIAGDKFTLPECTYTAPNGMEFDKWDMGKPGEQIDVSNNLNIKAYWKTVPNYTVTVWNDGNGTAWASRASGVAGTDVTLTAEPNSGYQFKEWQVVSGDVIITDNKFTISNKNVEVRAAFEKIPATTSVGDTSTQIDRSTDTVTNEVKIGDTIKGADNTSYVITSTETNQLTVAYVNVADINVATLSIPDTITSGGNIYKVTEIKANAFKNNKKLKKITIGKNITKIGKNAFCGCKNLKTVIIKTKKLTGKTVGANAFKGIHAKAKIKVPKDELKIYKKILKSRGVKGKRQRITK